MLLDIVLLITGFVLLHFGCSQILQKIPKIATHVKLPHWMASGFLLAFGTSLPEMIVIIHAAHANVPEIGINSIIGSNTINLALALGLIWSIFGLQKVTIRPKIFIQLLAIQGLLAILLLFYEINALSACVLLTCFIFFMIAASLNKDKTPRPEQQVDQVDWFIIIVSLLCMPLGSYFILCAVQNMNNIFNISSNFLGTVILAFGASLPEIYTSFLALKNNQANAALGNIISANIINSTVMVAIIGFTVSYVNESARLSIDILWMLGIAILASALLIFSKRTKLSGIILLLTYLLYLTSWLW